MPSLLFRLERRARLLTGGAACLTPLLLLLLNTKPLQLQPTCDAHGYAVNAVNPAMTAVRRMDTESSCRKSPAPGRWVACGANR